MNNQERMFHLCLRKHITADEEIIRRITREIYNVHKEIMMDLGTEFIRVITASFEINYEQK